MGFFSLNQIINKKMDGQKINMKVARGKELAKTVGKEIEAIAPDELNLTESFQEEKNNFLKEYAKDIVYLDEDSLKKAKIFNKLLEIKEKYPDENLQKFVTQYFENNGHATDEMVYIVSSTAKEVEKYFKNPNKKNNMETNFKQVEKLRPRMLRALKAVGISYKNIPSTEQVVKDFNNIILVNSSRNDFDFGDFLDKVVDAGNKVSDIADAVGNTVDNVGNIVSGGTPSQRPDLIINPPINGDQAIKDFVNSEKNAINTNYFIFGGIALVVIILLVVILKK